MREVGEPKPRFIIYRNNIAIDNRLIEMRNGNLDMIHDLSPEGTFSIVKEDPNTQGWFPGFPYAHPDPTLPMFIFNHQNPKFQDKRVRWALALMLDARALSMASYRGAATLSAISIPPTGTHPRDYHAPLQDWLINYEIDTGTRKIKPYDPTIGLQIAEMVRPQFGDQVPTDETAIRNSFGYGWWKQDLQAAEELLTAAGFSKQGGKWMQPDGTPFAFTIMVWPEGVINRLAIMGAQQWTQAGVEVTTEVVTDSWDRQAAGNYKRTWRGRWRPMAAIRTSPSSSTASTASTLQSPARCSQPATGCVGRTRGSMPSSSRFAVSTSMTPGRLNWDMNS